MSKPISRNKASKSGGKGTQENPVMEVVNEIGNWIAGMYLIAMLVIFPLFFQNNYYNMGDAKYFFFQRVTITLAFIMFLPMAVLGFEEIRQKKKELLTLVDCIVLAYLLLAVISWAISRYRAETWVGSKDWYMGLKSQLLFGAIYFILSRFGTGRRWPLWAAGGSAACVFTVSYLHRFMIDPFGLYEGITGYNIVLFLGTIGQATWYSSYIAVVLPVFMGIYMIGRFQDDKKQRIVRALLGALIFLGFCTSVTQNSDSIYVGIGLALLLLLWFALEDGALWLRFLELCLLGASAAKLTGVLQILFPERIPELEPLSLFVTQSGVGWAALAALAVLYLVSRKLLKTKPWPKKIICRIRRVFYILLVVVIVSIPVLVWCVTTGKLNVGGVLSQTGYLTFSGGWGNGRGKNWMFAAKMFREFPFVRKLFGCGPDGMLFHSYEYYPQEMFQIVSGTIVTNAHNEWLTALLDYGILGGTAYLAIFISFIVTVVKHWKTRPECIGAGAAAIAYIGHNFFCYQQAVCTPLIFLVMGVTMYSLRREKA